MIDGTMMAITTTVVVTAETGVGVQEEMIGEIITEVETLNTMIVVNVTVIDMTVMTITNHVEEMALTAVVTVGGIFPRVFKISGIPDIIHLIITLEKRIQIFLLGMLRKINPIMSTNINLDLLIMTNTTMKHWPRTTKTNQMLRINQQ